jgi:hypothetical protein
MKVQVILYTFQGIVEDPIIFSTERKARNFIKKQFKDQGIKYLKMVDKKIEHHEYYDEYTWDSDYEIHWYESKVL